eukprot:TRINITY_DN1999_c2_g1_i1.p1 TRINITY_DN1999_c2_g1~~TRINITY_DN1999_c2_g1_i1.p1  ORF type:complete len:233 (+),score=38.13 TRINITY_DN1999_c2_g1_i1:85-783(+)
MMTGTGSRDESQGQQNVQQFQQQSQIPSKEQLDNYITQSGVNYIIKEMVTKLCLNQPRNPVPFMIEFLQDYYTEQERKRSISSLPLEKPSNNPHNGRRGAISCETVPKTEGVYLPPALPKDEETRKRLETALKKTVMFTQMSEEEQSRMFDAMVEVYHRAGDIIFRQGDEGDKFYVIDSGECDVMVTNEDGSYSHVLTSYPLECFGELALIYGSPRAATLKVEKKSLKLNLS